MEKRIQEFECRLKSLIEEFPDIAPMFRAQSSVGRRTFLVDIQKNSEVTSAHMDSLCRRLGFTANVVGMEFEADGNNYRVIDIKPRAPKYPMICLNLTTGQKYKFPVSRVKTLLGGDKMINRAKSLSSLSGDVI